MKKVIDNETRRYNYFYKKYTYIKILIDRLLYKCVCVWDYLLIFNCQLSLIIKLYSKCVHDLLLPHDNYIITFMLMRWDLMFIH